jgi:hypothetical protein
MPTLLGDVRCWGQAENIRSQRVFRLLPETDLSQSNARVSPTELYLFSSPVHDVEVWNRPRLVVRLTRKPE